MNNTLNLVIQTCCDFYGLEQGALSESGRSWRALSARKNAIRALVEMFNTPKEDALMYLGVSSGYIYRALATEIPQELKDRLDKLRIIEDKENV